LAKEEPNQDANSLVRRSWMKSMLGVNIPFENLLGALQRRLKFKAVFLNRRAAVRYRALASIIPDPRLIEKRIYRAAI
jgi:hypothetical protein